MNVGGPNSLGGEKLSGKKEERLLRGFIVKGGNNQNKQRSGRKAP